MNAVQVYPFAEGAIYHVITAPERVTDIALQPGEGLVAVASGDTVRWVIGDTTSGSGADKRTHVLVKPFSAGLATNLVITTDRRSYQIALTSVPRSAMAALSWTYPQDALLALKRVTAAIEAAILAVLLGFVPTLLFATGLLHWVRRRWKAIRSAVTHDKRLQPNGFAPPWATARSSPCSTSRSP